MWKRLEGYGWMAVGPISFIHSFIHWSMPVPSWCANVCSAACPTQGPIDSSCSQVGYDHLRIVTSIGSLHTWTLAINFMWLHTPSSLPPSAPFTFPPPPSPHYNMYKSACIVCRSSPLMMTPWGKTLGYWQISALFIFSLASVVQELSTCFLPFPLPYKLWSLIQLWSQCSLVHIYLPVGGVKGCFIYEPACTEWYRMYFTVIHFVLLC